MKAFPLVIIMTLPLIAQESDPQQNSLELPVSLARFDLDKDGQLSSSERATAITTLRAERKLIWSRYKACSAELRDIVLQKNRPSLDNPEYMARFDADKDGVITPKEKSAAVRALHTERAKLRERKEELLAERSALSKVKSQNQIALADAYSMRIP